MNAMKQTIYRKWKHFTIVTYEGSHNNRTGYRYCGYLGKRLIMQTSNPHILKRYLDTIKLPDSTNHSPGQD